MIQLPVDKKIILFDGVCNLCDKSVQYIIKKDKKDIFRFVAIQSTLGQQIISNLKIDTLKIDSIILYESSITYYYKAQAALRIAKQLGGIISILSIFLMLPNSFLNLFYDIIAKNRYQWFGKKDSCMVPNPKLNYKFL